MKLTEGRTATQNLVRSYGAEGITLMAAPDVHALPLLLTATHVGTSLQGRALESLTEEDIVAIEERRPDVVLVGSAGEPVRVPAALRRRLESRRIAIEAMQLGAACRTFNVLVQEDRAVMALLLP